MFRKLSYFMIALIFAPIALGWATLPVQASADVEIGKPAPDFTATDIHGKEITLSTFKGKNVVLEWSNPSCPFVLKHYGIGNMQAAQKKAVDGGAVWLTIVSSAKEKQGNMTAEQAIAYEKEVGANATTRIADETGTIGHMYGAKTTPHMFVINKEGILVYQGAIDDQPSPDPKSVEGAKNLVLAALDDLAAGKDVQVATTASYGCGVKY